MNIQPIKTKKIILGDQITDILDKSLTEIGEGSILVVTSKIISICEGNVVEINDKEEKYRLAKREADLFLPEKTPYGFYLTIKHNMLIANSGIDESNGDGKLILWPKYPWRSAKEIRKYLVKRFRVNNIGVLVTDSKTAPLRWGTTGIALSFAGFKALNNYIGEPDIFGRKLIATKANIADGLAAGAVAVMGEGNEQTPLALITGVKNVKFSQNSPTEKEIGELRINIKDDLYGQILSGVKWVTKK